MRTKHDINAIIATGSRLFRKKGYNQVGINEILEVSGIPKGSFYNFFKNKEDFGVQVIAWYGTSQNAFIADMLKPANGTPIERLRFLYKTFINLNEQEGLDSGCLINNMAIELGGQETALGVEANRQFQFWIQTITKTILEGQEKNEIRKDFTAELLAIQLHTGLFGAYTLMKAQKSRSPLDQWFDMAFTFIVS